MTALSEASKPAPLSRQLERQARRIAAEARLTPPPDELLRATCRRLALHLELIDRTRALYSLLRTSLLEDECRLGADLERVQRLLPGYSSEEATLKARLQTIEKERRQLLAKETESSNEQTTELLSLLLQHQQLEPPHEDR